MAERKATMSDQEFIERMVEQTRKTMTGLRGGYVIGKFPAHVKNKLQSAEYCKLLGDKTAWEGIYKAALDKSCVISFRLPGTRTREDAFREYFALSEYLEFVTLFVCAYNILIERLKTCGTDHSITIEKLQKIVDEIKFPRVQAYWRRTLEIITYFVFCDVMADKRDNVQEDAVKNLVTIKRALGEFKTTN